MDPENDFATQEKRDDVRRNLQNAIREEVEYQDASIGQEELDHLVHVFVWGEHKYELANFTDEELVAAITTLAVKQKVDRVELPTWASDLRMELTRARDRHDDIKVPIHRMRIQADKVELARILWPTLRAKCEAEYAENNVRTPLLSLVLDIRQIANRLTGIFAL
jgi:L-lactate utilization protein LutC